MPKVRVQGSGYRSAFESAKAIISAGMLSEEMSDCYIDSDNCIHNGPNVFEFIDGDELGDKQAESEFRIESDGASWFAPIRRAAEGKATLDEASDSHLWEEFLADVSRRYHDKYFLVSCNKRNDPKSGDETERAFELYNNFAKNIMNCLYPQITDWEFYENKESESYDDIYGLSLRLQIGTGGEKEIPVLGTLYFKKHGAYRMIPLSAEDAVNIEKNLDSSSDFSSSSMPSPSDIDETNNTLNTLFNELTRIINEDKAGNNLVDCLHYDEDDLVGIEGLLSRIQNDNKMLVCKQVEILGISHVNWEKYSYIISNKRTGSDMFSIIGGIDGKVVMTCLGCPDPTDLILNNRIFFTDPDNGENVSLALDPSSMTLGFDDTTFDKVNRSGLFSSHHMTIGSLCGMPRGNKPCSKIKCKSALVEVRTPGGIAGFCRDCAFPEVLYTDTDGNFHYTPMLRLDTDSMRLVPATEIADNSCQFCGRTVSTLHHSAYCKLCDTVHFPNGAAIRIAEEAYAKYKDILPLHMRFTSGPKHCYEDTELLIFVVGDKKYIFHKFWLDSKGYIKSPELKMD